MKINPTRKTPSTGKPGKRKNFRLLLYLAVFGVMAGGATTIMVLNPALLERTLSILPIGPTETNQESLAEVEALNIQNEVTSSETDLLKDQLMAIQSSEPSLAPVPDQAIEELRNDLLELDERVAFQAKTGLELTQRLTEIKNGQDDLRKQLAEITTRLSMREGVDMDTMTTMASRQSHLENRLLETGHQLTTSIDAIVGSLSLVKQQLARQEDMVSDLASDLYLLSRYGYGGETQSSFPITLKRAENVNPGEITGEPPAREIRRGDYRVGDWIQGYGEVLSIHRTVEGDHLTTENGEIFAAARPEEE